MAEDDFSFKFVPVITYGEATETDSCVIFPPLKKYSHGVFEGKTTWQLLINIEQKLKLPQLYQRSYTLYTST